MSDLSEFLGVAGAESTSDEPLTCYLCKNPVRRGDVLYVGLEEGKFPAHAQCFMDSVSGPALQAYFDEMGAIYDAVVRGDGIPDKCPRFPWSPSDE